jgi:hypothetical protein
MLDVATYMIDRRRLQELRSTASRALSFIVPLRQFVCRSHVRQENSKHSTQQRSTDHITMKSHYITLSANVDTSLLPHHTA